MNGGIISYNRARSASFVCPLNRDKVWMMVRDDSVAPSHQFGRFSMAIQSAVDAGFYSLVHEVLEAEKRRTVKSRRNELRQSYECVQLIAPYRKGRLPVAAEFRHVHCQDFLLAEWPTTTTTCPRIRYCSCCLGRRHSCISPPRSHHTPVLSDDRAEYLIGCRFTGRLVTPAK